MRKPSGVRCKQRRIPDAGTPEEIFGREARSDPLVIEPCVGVSEIEYGERALAETLRQVDAARAHVVNPREQSKIGHWSPQLKRLVRRPLGDWLEAHGYDPAAHEESGRRPRVH